MAERRKNRKKKELPESTNDNGKPTKEECAVAKYIRQRLPEKKTSLLGHKVEYFIASKAIDCLLDSQWAKKSGSEEALFTTRESVVAFLDRLLQRKFFHRARKIIVNKELKKKKKDEVEEECGKEKEKEKETSKKSAKMQKDDEKSRDSDKIEDKKDGDSAGKKKEKKKIKLDMHLEQLFVDGNEVYVWIYDPIPMRTWIIGMLLVAGAVLVCLFPLWPQIIRTYIYYLSVAAALFLVFIIGLAIIRLIIFVLVWSVTFGKHHIWLLPNLTEDVGFFDSFWPLYHYEYRGSIEDGNGGEEEETKDENNEKEKSDSGSEPEKKEEDQANSESEHDSLEDKTTKTDNGFEILDAEEDEEES